MPQFSESIDIARPPEDVWRAIGTPERWFEGYLETRSRSADQGEDLLPARALPLEPVSHWDLSAGRG